MTSRAQRVERKVQLIAQSDEERRRLRLAFSQLREGLAPLTSGPASAPLKILWGLLGYAGPAAAVLNRLGGVVRVVALGVVAFKAVSRWRKRKAGA